VARAFVCADVSDFLVYATSGGIHGLPVDPTVTSKPFAPITLVRRVRTFDVIYENRSLIVVSGGRLKKVAVDNGQVIELLAPRNVSSSLYQSHN